jgi:hypothetical protein
MNDRFELIDKWSYADKGVNFTDYVLLDKQTGKLIKKRIEWK